MESGGNAARAGLKVGDQVLYTSSFFGDELWPADKLGFTKTAIQAKPDSVYFVVSRLAYDRMVAMRLLILLKLSEMIVLEFTLDSSCVCVYVPQNLILSDLRGGADVDVKRLPKRPAPPRFGRKLTESQKARSR